jgi:hypothetical protein
MEPKSKDLGFKGLMIRQKSAKTRLRRGVRRRAERDAALGAGSLNEGERPLVLNRG